MTHGIMPTTIQQTDWYKTRPPCVQKRVDQYPLDKMYRSFTTGHVLAIQGYIYKYKKCDTCQVWVLRINNFDRVKNDYTATVPFDDLVEMPEILRRKEWK